MNRYVRPLTAEERQELEHFLWSSVWRIARRGRAVPLSDQGFTIQLALIFGVKGLQEAPRSGRPRSTTSEQDDCISQVVEKSPLTLGCLMTVWTVVSLCSHLAGLGIQIGPATLRRRLHELKFRWRRPRLAVMRRDPQGSTRMQLVAQAISHATPDTHILVGDQTKMQHLPVLRARWMRIASQLRIPTPEDNRYFYIFGVLNILTGGLTYGLFNKQNRFTLIEFLERILLVYPTGPIILILDNAKYHTAKDVLKWLGKHPRLTVSWLPKYAPELNPVDKIWWYLKQKVAANRRYRTIERLMKAVKAFLDQMDNEEILQLTSLLPEKTSV